MKDISIKLNFKATDSFLNNLRKYFSFSIVEEVCDNCLSLDKEIFVDWKYISSLLNSKNYNFQFIDFYFEEIEKDRYVDSGIRYTFRKELDYCNKPIVRYESNIDNYNSILFLDRDGIINKDSGYVYQFSEDIIFEDAINLIKLANEKNIKVAIVTNQAGVARGKYSISEVELFHRELLTYIKNKGAIIDHIEICPFHKDKGVSPWNFDSLLRKPNPGMLLRAASALSGSLLKSVMLGDKPSDELNIFGPSYFLLMGDYKITQKENVFESRSQFFEEVSKYLNKILDFS